MTYQIAIPSFRRAETLKRKTLAWLDRMNVPLERRTIFVADAEEYEAYTRALGPNTRLVVAVPGMRAVRNYIQAYYPEGTRVLNLDDDLTGVELRVSEKQTVPVPDMAWVEEGFTLAARGGARLWGIYPVHNALFMKPTVTYDLRYIVGCVWGVVNGRESRLAVTLDDKEDVERTLRFYLADGRVARLNYLAPRTNYYGEPGGMQVERTELRVTESARELCRRYPRLCTLNTSKKSGHAEVRLKDKRGKP